MRKQHESARALGKRKAGGGLARVDLHLGRERQEPPHVVVRQLAEVLVPEPDRVERLGRDHRDDLVGLTPELCKRVQRRRRYRDDDQLRPLSPDGGHSRPHRRAGRETVVDEHHHLARKLGRRAVAAIRALAALELGELPLGDPVDDVVAEPQLANQLVVQDARPAGRNRPHRQLRLAGVAELADEEDVERRAERPRHLARDGHAAARQRQHDDVVAARQRGEALAEQPAALGPVTETPGVAHPPRIMY